jgi:CHAD domain-containing protein
MVCLMWGKIRERERERGSQREWDVFRLHREGHREKIDTKYQD